MLTAIIHGKAGRIQLQGEETRVRWREIFQRSEDLLTSVFFSRLRYLSPESICRVMALLVGDQAATELGELQHIEFWPRLEGANDRSWVEPDVRIHFARASVVIEVKPPFGGAQRIEQWRAQIQALAQEWTEEDDAPLHFYYVALGNNTPQEDAAMKIDFGVEYAFTPILRQAEWHQIVLALRSLHVHATPSDRAVFDDWHKAFVLFGIPVQPAFQWSDLLAWADRCGLSTAEVPWSVWSKPTSSTPLSRTNIPASSKGISSSCVNWSALQNFSINNPLQLP